MFVCVGVELFCSDVDLARNTLFAHCLNLAITLLRNFELSTRPIDVSMKRRTAIYGLASVLLLWLLYLAFDYAVGLSRLTTVESVAVTRLEYGIPAVVHQTWKVSVSPPAELLRWRNGCVRVNNGFAFRMYSDEALNVFTSTQYPRYLALFEHLHGVCKSHSA
jgi:hypothetical protein